jgi:hypothetical protein
MKSSLCVIVLFLATAFAGGQSAKKSDGLDLTKFSSEQLRACFDDPKVCGSADAEAISSELYGRISAMSSEKLVACFEDWKICGAGESISTGWLISDELAHRGSPHQLLLRYWKEPNREIRDGIVHVAYHFKNAEVTAFMRKVLAQASSDESDEEELYWPANYLAKECDPNGLKWLISKPQRSQGCMQFATTVPLFGKCRYRPAIPYLITYSLNDACLNIMGEAEEDLHDMFPHSPKEFTSIESMQKYYCGRAKQEGLKIDCKSK